jgi:hypothetical protein
MFSGLNLMVVEFFYDPGHKVFLAGKNINGFGQAKLIMGPSIEIIMLFF